MHTHGLPQSGPWPEHDMGVSFQKLRELEGEMVCIDQTSSIGNARPGDLVSKIRD